MPRPSRPRAPSSLRPRLAGPEETRRRTPRNTVTRIAVAALSARVLAEAAAREGIDAVALDLFGDRDTCRAAATWLPIGTPESMQVDAATLLDALQTLARSGDAHGWIAGAGFEGRPDLLAAGAARLPLLGTASEDVWRVRDPTTFFGFLAARGFQFPAVRPVQSSDTRGWLTKDAGGCGGWHITRAAEPATAPVTSRLYQQREARGVPMSATFIANGREAIVLGFNEQIVAALGARPYVYRGVLGPVPVDSAVAREVEAAVQACTEAFALRGLASLDFLLDDGRVLVLEVNPRPPASLALYPRVGDAGSLQAHLHACVDGRLPRVDTSAALPNATASVARFGSAASSLPVHGNEIVYAPYDLECDAAMADHLANLPNTHDLPRAATRFAACEPVCSVSAGGATAAAVRGELARRRDRLLSFLDDSRLRFLDESSARFLEVAK
jgi:uncharacterized protein